MIYCGKVYSSKGLTMGWGVASGDAGEKTSASSVLEVGVA